METLPQSAEESSSTAAKFPLLSDHVRNIVQRALPNVSEIEDGTINLITQCLMELASSLSYESISIATSEGRTRVEGADLLDALRGYGFENYIKPMDMFMDAYHIHADTCQICKGPVAKSADSNAAGITTRALPKKDWSVKEPIARKISAPLKAKKPTVRADWEDPGYVARVQRHIMKGMTDALTHSNPNLILGVLANEIKLPLSQVQNMFYQFKNQREGLNASNAGASSSNSGSGMPGMQQVNVGMPRPPMLHQQQHPPSYAPITGPRPAVYSAGGPLLTQSNVRWPPVQTPRPPPFPYQPQNGNPGAVPTNNTYTSG